MGEVIFFKKLDEPIPWEHTVNGKIHKGVKTGDFVCTDERVEKVWFYGALRDGLAKAFAEFIFKDGTRHRVQIKSENMEDEAEAFLKTITQTPKK